MRLLYSKYGLIQGRLFWLSLQTLRLLGKVEANIDKFI